MSILLTGGTGYIGSHTAAVLVEAGFEVVLLDNLSNSRRDVVERLRQITGRTLPFIAMLETPASCIACNPRA